jgi:prepilin-type processing-associated H-X9-DG protein
MKTSIVCKRAHAFTGLELLVVLAVIFTLVVLLVLPYLAKAKHRGGHHIRCVSNLKMVALSFKMYAGDNNQKFPMADYAASAATNPAAIPPLPVWQYYLAMSNELGFAKILLCPQDAVRFTNAAADFSSTTQGLAHATKQNAATSYFLGLHAEETKWNGLLAGDRNLANSARAFPYSSAGGNVVDVSTNSVWSQLPGQKHHDNAGNYALADGSVQQASHARLQEALRLARDYYGTNANRFLFPQ